MRLSSLLLDPKVHLVAVVEMASRDDHLDKSVMVIDFW